MAKTSADVTYRQGIYRTQGGNAMVVKATATQTVLGGLNIASGGNVTIAAGGKVSVAALATQTISGVQNVAAGGALNLATGSRFKRAFRTATAAVTFTAAKSGLTLVSNVAGLVHTLPAATTAGAGVNFRVLVGESALATDGAVTVKIRPNAADKILGVVAGATDSEVLQMTGASDAIGDFVEVESNGTTGWYVIGSRGTWVHAAAT